MRQHARHGWQRLQQVGRRARGSPRGQHLPAQARTLAPEGVGRLGGRHTDGDDPRRQPVKQRDGPRRAAVPGQPVPSGRPGAADSTDRGSPDTVRRPSSRGARAATTGHDCASARPSASRWNGASWPRTRLNFSTQRRRPSWETWKTARCRSSPLPSASTQAGSAGSPSSRTAASSSGGAGRSAGVTRVASARPGTTRDSRGDAPATAARARLRACTAGSCSGAVCRRCCCSDRDRSSGTTRTGRDGSPRSTSGCARRRSEPRTRAPTIRWAAAGAASAAARSDTTRSARAVERTGRTSSPASRSPAANGASCLPPMTRTVSTGTGTVKRRSAARRVTVGRQVRGRGGAGARGRDGSRRQSGLPGRCRPGSREVRRGPPRRRRRGRRRVIPRRRRSRRAGRRCRARSPRRSVRGASSPAGSW